MINKILNKLKKNQYQVEYKRLETTTDGDGLNISQKKLINLLNYTKKSGTSYSAGSFNVGYHSFEIDGIDLKGQRNPKQRLQNLPFSFEGLSVLDIGCNQGGMLFALKDQIKSGIGIDYDSRMINAANKIKSYTKSHNLDYYVFNLEKEDLNLINDFIPEPKVDIVFLLSVCMWIENWKEVIAFCSKISERMVFESNGKDEQQDEQFVVLKENYKHVDLVSEKSDDDPSQKNRRLYYCYN